MDDEVNHDKKIDDMLTGIKEDCTMDNILFKLEEDHKKADILSKLDEDNDYVFSTLPCPFLGSDHYCHVYESRPNACREFPHTQQRNILQKLKITYHNTHICPAVSLVVEGLKQKYVL